MGIRNPYTPAQMPQVDFGNESDLPPEVKAQLDYARALGAQAAPMAGPEEPSPGIGIPFTGRTIPGTAIDRASPALLSVLRSYAPAVRGKNRDLANIASAVGQTFLGSRVAGAQDRARSHAEDLALAKEQRAQQSYDRRDAARSAASSLAAWRHDKQRQAEKAAELAGKTPPMTPDEKIAFDVKRARALYGATPHPDPNKPDAPMLSPEDQQTWGEAVAKGAPLPAFGMGASADRTAVLSHAAQYLRATGGDINANRSLAKSLTASHANIRKMYDNTTAFENTALKNADVVVRTLQGLADTGSPLLNAPLRSIGKDVFGSKGIVAYETARKVVSPEFARLLQSANASGVLTDTAAKEVKDLLSPGATAGQVLRALSILRQDAAYRKQSYVEQLGTITKSFGDIGLTPTGSKPQRDPQFVPKLEAKMRSVALGNDPKARVAGLQAIKAEADSAGISDVDWQAIANRVRGTLPKKGGR